MSPDPLLAGGVWGGEGKRGGGWRGRREKEEEGGGEGKEGRGRRGQRVHVGGAEERRKRGREEEERERGRGGDMEKEVNAAGLSLCS